MEGDGGSDFGLDFGRSSVFRVAPPGSEGLLAQVWGNDEDAAYDRLPLR